MTNVSGQELAVDTVRREPPQVQQVIDRCSSLTAPTILFGEEEQVSIVLSQGPRRSILQLAVATNRTHCWLLGCCPVDHRKVTILMPTYVLLCHALQDALQQGCQVHDREGFFSLTLEFHQQEIVSLRRQFLSSKRAERSLRKAAQQITAFVLARQGEQLPLLNEHQLMVRAAQSSVWEAERKYLLDRLLQQQPELTVEELLHELDRRLPYREE